MKPSFLIFLIFSFIFASLMKRSAAEQDEKNAAFWERERSSNQTRRKDISNLNYITIPYEALPFLENPSKRIYSYEQDILTLKDKKILNLTGITNTELKLTYGPANLPLLTQYDENYMRLVAILGKWAQALIDENYTDEAQIVLETAVEAGCDSSSIYLNLASIYQTKGINKIPYLIEKISQSSSLMKDVIIKKLEEF